MEAAPEGGNNVPGDFSGFAGAILFEAPDGGETRVPEKDKKEEGGALMCYAGKERGAELTVWRDQRGVGLENEFQMLSRSGGTTEIVHTWDTINPVLPKDFWGTPAEVKVVDPWEFVGKAYPLEKALFQKEVHGTVAAVHSVRQDEDGNFYLVVSTRMTQGPYKALANVKVGERRILRNMMSRVMGWNEQTKKTTRDYRDYTIAHVDIEGIWVAYVVVMPRSAAGAGDRCQMCFPLVPAETPEELKGEVPRKQEFVGFDLAAQGKCGAGEFAAEAFEAMDAVDGMGRVELDTSSVPSKVRPKPTMFHPTEMTKEEFVGYVEKDAVEAWGRR